eukprot:c1987_g1_i2.p1 GENE.c1987_g1_i2~~c1987_g1_i2.p1  ORF type:complete len:237 (-),score=63.05 c1987_g1_i2:55-765(-)
MEGEQYAQNERPLPDEHTAAVLIQKALRTFFARKIAGDLMFHKFMAEEIEREEQERKRIAESLSMLDNLKLRQAMDKRFQDMLGSGSSSTLNNLNDSSALINAGAGDDSVIDLPPLTSEALQRATSAMAPEMEEFRHIYTDHQMPLRVENDPPQSISFETQVVPIDLTIITKDSIRLMHTNELRELAGYLSTLVKGRFHALVSELQRRDELRSERELRYTMIRDLIKRLQQTQSEY